MCSHKRGNGGETPDHDHHDHVTVFGVSARVDIKPRTRRENRATARFRPFAGVPATIDPDRQSNPSRNANTSAKLHNSRFLRFCEQPFNGSLVCWNTPVLATFSLCPQNPLLQHIVKARMCDNHDIHFHFGTSPAKEPVPKLLDQSATRRPARRANHPHPRPPTRPSARPVPPGSPRSPRQPYRSPPRLSSPPSYQSRA